VAQAAVQKRGSVRNINLTQWMYIWVTVGATVAVVVILFLIFINTTLRNINGDLVVTTSNLVGDQAIEGDVVDLPTQIEKVSGTLVTIEGSVKPIPSQVNTILGLLGSIDGNLAKVDPTLKGITSNVGGIVNNLNSIGGSLTSIGGVVKNVDPALVDISRSLDNITKTVVSLKGVLNEVQLAGKGSTQDIIVQIDRILGLVDGLKSDTGNILGGLTDVNGYLDGICKNIPPPQTGC